MYNCIIIDDEELAIKLLSTYVEKSNDLRLVASFQNPMEALKVFADHTIDVVFLDIQMPEIKGTDFAKLLDDNIKVVFTTAYSEFAVDGFELNAIDYLLKPITFERFDMAVQKIRKTNSKPTTETSITIKSGYDFIIQSFSNINYIESDSEYVMYYCNDKKIMSYQSIKSLMDKLPDSQFMRVHRSYIINKSKVNGFKDKKILINDVKIPVSETYIDAVKKEFNF
jgi:DNA-binding LytR/AlgR family response regulator